MRSLAPMLNTSSPVSRIATELLPSRWPLRLYLLGLAVALLAVACSGLAAWLQLWVAVPLLLWLAMLEWRAQRQGHALHVDPTFISCTLTSGDVLEAEWPLPGMANRYWISIGFPTDRKSTRLNSSHVRISYAVFCLKKKM